MRLNITGNRFGFVPEDLITVGKRANNKKRNFLFISKLLGKHIIVKPDIVKGAGVLLASLKYKELENGSIIKYIKGSNTDIQKEINQSTKESHNVLVIGFAETATGLGMGVASAVRGCTYQTTTREPVVGMKNLLSFQEEHSHAVEHKCFSLIDGDFSGYDEIILVDDEMTTGRTALNLIRDMKRKYGVRKYSILTILDWRNDNDLLRYEEFKKKQEVELSVYSVMSGQIQTKSDKEFKCPEPEKISVKTDVIPVGGLETVSIETKSENSSDITETEYFKNSGRFGVKFENILLLEERCRKIAEKINRKPNEKILVLGHGENIYIPSRVAAYMGNEGRCDFRTTTRSPVMCDGKTIQSSCCFIDRGVKYYFYNREYIERKYDRVILLSEQPVKTKLCRNMVSMTI